jgi:hypothetical protein
VAKDLGTWPPEQATVLVQVLQRANLTPEAKRTRDGILVTVPDDQADVAVRALADNMDAIADAARSRAEARRRRAREGGLAHPAARVGRASPSSPPSACAARHVPSRSCSSACSCSAPSHA